MHYVLLNLGPFTVTEVTELVKSKLLDETGVEILKVLMWRIICYRWSDQVKPNLPGLDDLSIFTISKSSAAIF